MILLAFGALLVASLIWTILELSLHTFRVHPLRKGFIFGFAAVGTALAMTLALVPLVTTRGVPYGAQVPIIGWFVCPSSFAYIVLIDIREPGFPSLIKMAMFTAFANAAFYAAIGGRVGEMVCRPAKLLS